MHRKLDIEKVYHGHWGEEVEQIKLERSVTIFQRNEVVIVDKKDVSKIIHDAGDVFMMT